MYKLMGADIVNMTSCLEVYFFRELEIPVIAISLITNKIELDKPILAHEISGNIAKYKDAIPNAVKVLIDGLGDHIMLEDLNTEIYDTSILDIRSNAC